jgi:uncharacterized repeat protein (TIGR01451 family)
VPSLTAGESRSVTFVARVNASSPVPPDGTVLQSTATATSSAGTDSSIAEVTVRTAPAMTLGLVEDRDPVVPGASLTYALALGNAGATPSAAGVLRMPVPPGTTFVSASGGGVVVGDEVQWNVAAMAAGTIQRYQVVVQVGAAAMAGDLIESEAEFSAGATSLARAQRVTAVAATPPGMAVALAATPDPVEPGERVWFTLTYANRSGATVANWKVTATVPEYATVESNQDSDALCNGSTLGCGAGGVLSWTASSLAAGESRSLTYVARVASGASAPPEGTLLRSTATVSSALPGEASASALVAVDPSPSIALGVVEDSDPVALGGQLTYTLVLGNVGAVQSPAGVLSLAVPAGTTLASATGGGTLVGGAVQWNVAPIAPGASNRYQVVVQVGVGLAVGDLLRSVAEFSAGASTFARADVVTTIASAALVTRIASVALAATPDPVKPGEWVRFTVTLANLTAAPVGNWTIAATVPDHTTVESNQDSGALCDGSTLGCGPGGTLTWTVPSLAPTESRSVTYVARVASGASAPPDGSLLQSTATVASALPGEVSATAQVVVDATPTMTLGLVEDRDPVVIGNTVVYTLVLGNPTGVPSPAGVLRMSMPPGTTFASATGGGSLSGNEVLWNVGAVAAGTAQRFQVVLLASPSVAAGDLLEVGAEFAVGVTTVARASITTLVAATEPSASIEMTASPDPVKPGERARFAVTFANRTGFAVNGWNVTATVPEYTVVESNEDSGALCNGSVLGCGAGGTLSWTVPSLEAGESRTVSFWAIVSGGASAPPDGALLRSFGERHGRGRRDAASDARRDRRPGSGASGRCADLRALAGQSRRRTVAFVRTDDGRPVGDGVRGGDGGRNTSGEPGAVERRRDGRGCQQPLRAARAGRCRDAGGTRDRGRRGRRRRYDPSRARGRRDHRRDRSRACRDRACGDAESGEARGTGAVHRDLRQPHGVCRQRLDGDGDRAGTHDGGVERGLRRALQRQHAGLRAGRDACVDGAKPRRR